MCVDIFSLLRYTLSYLILIYLSSWCDICKDVTDLTNVDVNRHSKSSHQRSLTLVDRRLTLSQSY